MFVNKSCVRVVDVLAWAESSLMLFHGEHAIFKLVQEALVLDYLITFEYI